MNNYVTPDLSLAAFLLMRGLKIESADRDPSGKFIFSFSDPDNKGKILALDFINSEFCEYDNHVRNLKKIIYSK
tara:strand:- start:306 stop:527 length:222 start_codon:yes stop_codon:yes gene_type:complete